MRQCGCCTLCCKLLPVKSIGKKALTKCEHQRTGRGCAIHDRLPTACRVWSCGWLLQEGTTELSRPDRSHYVIDLMPDFITLGNNQTGERREQPCLQVWMDPDFPDAHEDPGLRQVLVTNNIPALLRYGSHEAKVLFPPALAEDGEWHLVDSGMKEGEHKMEEIAKVLGL